MVFSTTDAVARSDDTLVLQRFDGAQIKIDGKLDEPSWQGAPIINALVIIDPDTLADTPWATDVRAFYTDKGLYVGIYNEQPEDTIVERLSPRDGSVSRDGNFITLDPTGTGLFGYWFGVNLGGSLQDGTVLPERQFSRQWDGPWNGAAARAEGGWSTEFFIPWSMMTMPEVTAARQGLGFYVSRSVAYIDQRWAFPGLPDTKPAFLSTLQQLEIEGITPSKQFNIFPYASTSYDNVSTGGKDTYKAGADIFWRPTSNVQISTTLNPDFGNVEADNVVVNLTAIEPFFPERRAFFLEGVEIFNTSPRSQSGGDNGAPVTLINTRRIGAQPIATGINDFALTDIEKNQPTEIIGALKVIGQNGKIRYGTLAAFEEDTLLEGEINGDPFSTEQTGRDFGVARVLYEDTSTGARRSVGWLGTVIQHPQLDAITQGVDAHYLSKTGKWNTDLQLLYSDVDNKQGSGAFVDVGYVPAQGRRHSLAFDYFSDDLDINDFGFLQRNDLIGGRYAYDRTESDVEGLRSRQTDLRWVQYYNKDQLLVRAGALASQELQFTNNNFLFYELSFFPERWDDINSGGNGNYKIDDRFRTGVFYGTNDAKALSIGAGTQYSDEALGGHTMQYTMELRWQPTDRFSAVAEVEFQDREGWLLQEDDREFTTFDARRWSPNLELDFFLSARQQFRITAQWAGIKAFEEERWLVPTEDGDLEQDFTTGANDNRDFSISRLTFQARYRWEIAPLSDLFVVYTRGSNVDSRPDDGFEDLARSSWSERLVDIFVVKLRYRMGG
jgi:hypothetical protein